ncbi:hypothetical protein [Pararhodobacter oceanensis]|uniref:hypothetical protein n=1 Tax=Pararhodobacter oceanensis TaxID=2172121 RepID=UPI003A8C8FEB
MRSLLMALSVTLASPALADVTHHIDARFGVAYQSDPNSPNGRVQTLYQGRYTSTYTHRADNGLQFRFELGVEVGNFEPRRPSAMAPNASIGVQFD